MSLKNIPLGTPELFNVIVEIPKGSAKKFEYDEAQDKIVLDFVFKNNFRFLFNYGFIPQTKAGDGDTVDVIVLGDEPIASGTVIQARAVGIMKMLDRGEEDDKIIAVPINNLQTEKYQDLADVPKQELQEFISFYAEVARQKQKTIQVTGFEDKAAAIVAIRKASL